LRKVGGGRKGDLPTNEDKLLYILMYMKLYPTYDALAIIANHYRSKCGDSVKLLLPKRHGHSLEEIFRAYPEIKDIFIAAWTDTGFQGAKDQHANTVMPVKASKNKPLTAEQKANNRVISGIRIVSEHAIGGFKRFKAASDIYRNKLPNFATY